jgi:hypothetical protein
MGAYGSPELPPNNNSYGYQSPYQSQPSYPNHYKSESKKGGCLKNGLIFLGLLAFFLFVYGFVSTLIGGSSSQVKDGTIPTMASSPTYSQSVYIPPTLVSSAPVPSVPATIDDSTDFLQGWTKTMVCDAYKLAKRYPQLTIVSNFKLMGFPAHTVILPLVTPQDILNAPDNVWF